MLAVQVLNGADPATIPVTNLIIERLAINRQALEGFYQVGLRRAYLEVTAENSGAVRLYRSVGFRRAKTLYKAVDG